jgi:hypothetical protein
MRLRRETAKRIFPQEKFAFEFPSMSKFALGPLLVLPFIPFGTTVLG